MFLLSVYAPPDIYKPCVVLITQAVDGEYAESIVYFVDTMFTDMAIEKIYGPIEQKYYVVAEHENEDDALMFHLRYACNWHNSKNEESSDEGVFYYEEIEKLCMGLEEKDEKEENVND